VRRNFVIDHGGQWRDDAQTTGELGVPLEPHAIAQDVVQNVVARLSQRIPVLPGADGALERLGGAFVLGLATSATRVVAETVLTKTGWDKFFAVVVSADEVARGKPQPDVYLRALDLLKAAPRRTPAIEDSANGIRSAHAAQLAVVSAAAR
jgi:HAD superfamily hydrolase (TIGR01509 family)